MHIPTNPDFKSLNLSHSLIIIAHTVASIISLKGVKYSKSKKISLASKKDVQVMTNLCIKKLEEKSFFKPLEKRPIMLENLRSIFSKMELSEKEIRILSSVFASLAKKG
jgi:tRNA/rRNA methyltransferase